MMSVQQPPDLHGPERIFNIQIPFSEQQHTNCRFHVEVRWSLVARYRCEFTDETVSAKRADNCSSPLVMM
jgi:hypothetical protein